jgi:hypothetical protein
MDHVACFDQGLRNRVADLHFDIFSPDPACDEGVVGANVENQLPCIAEFEIKASK